MKTALRGVGRGFGISVALTALCAFARADVLDDLIEHSRAAPAMRARYSLSFEVNPGVEVVPPPTSTLYIEYAPGAVRVENRLGEQALITVCTSERLTAQFVSSTGRPGLHGTVSLADIRAKLRPVEEQLRAVFPRSAATLEPAYDGPGAKVNWSFDERLQKANFELVATSDGVTTPFAWLDTLRAKSAELVLDGDVLRFETEGRFRGELRRDGLLQRLQGESPQGRYTFALEALETPPDASSFEPPPPPEGARDNSSELRRNALRAQFDQLRTRMYRALGREPEFDEALQKRTREMVKAFQERVLELALVDWLELAKRKRELIAARFKEFAASGRTPEQIDEQRRKELESLARGLEELLKSFDSLLIELHPRVAGEAHAAAFNAIERELLPKCFAERIATPSTKALEDALK
jgi:hypothetical protein